VVLGWPRTMSSILSSVRSSARALVRARVAGVRAHPKTKYLSAVRCRGVGMWPVRGAVYRRAAGRRLAAWCSPGGSKGYDMASGRGAVRGGVAGVTIIRGPRRT